MMEEIRRAAESRRKYARLEAAIKSVSLPRINGRLVPNVRFGRNGQLYRCLRRQWRIVTRDDSCYTMRNWLDALELHQENRGSEVFEEIIPEVSLAGLEFNDAFDLLKKLKKHGLDLRERPAIMPVIHVVDGEFSK